jgi:hypothetical protein
MCNSGYISFSWARFVINLNLIKYNISYYLIFEDNMRKIGKKKRIFWDDHKYLEFITNKSQHYILHIRQKICAINVMLRKKIY